MSGIYRLSSDEWRQWRLNPFFLVVVETAPPFEADQLLREATKTERANHPEGEPFQAIFDGEAVRDIAKGEQQSRDASGQQSDGSTQRVRVKLVSARSRLKDDVFKARGEVVMKAPNNRFVAKLTDPQTLQYRNRTTGPVPHLCTCKDYAGREDGKHHYMCPHNQTALQDERATRWVEEHQPVNRVFRRQRVPIRAEANEVIQTEPLVAPGDCQCATWEHAHKGSRHHPMCAMRASWEKHQSEEDEKRRAELSSSREDAEAERRKQSEREREAERVILPANEEAPASTTMPSPSLDDDEAVDETADKRSDGFFLIDESGQAVRPADPDEVENIDEMSMVTIAGKRFTVADAEGNPPPGVGSI